MIKFTFKMGGAVIVQPTGYEGSACHEATRPYTNAMNGKQTVKEISDSESVAVNNAQGQSQKAGQ